MQRWLVLPGVCLGILIGVLFWALLGVLLGLVILPVAWVVAQLRTPQGYMPYNGSVGADLLAVMRWMAGFLAPLGLFTGAVIGARAGCCREWRTLVPEILWGSVRGSTNGPAPWLLFPFLFMTVLPLRVAYRELFPAPYTVEEVTITHVGTTRPFTYTFDFPPNSRGDWQLSVQDSADEPRVKKGDRLRAYHKGDLREGRLLLPGQPLPQPKGELTDLTAVVVGTSAVAGFAFLGVPWMLCYLGGKFDD